MLDYKQSISWFHASVFKHLLSTEYYFTSSFRTSANPRQLFEAIYFSSWVYWKYTKEREAGFQWELFLNGLQGFEGSCLLWTAVCGESERVADTYSLPASFPALPLPLAPSPVYLSYWIHETQKTVLADLSFLESCSFLPALVVITTGLPK